MGLLYWLWTPDGMTGSSHQLPLFKSMAGRPEVIAHTWDLDTRNGCSSLSSLAQYGPICPNMVQYQLFRINQISTTKKNTTHIQFIQLLNMFACLEVVNAPKNLVQFWAQGPQQVPCPEHGEGPDMTRPRLSSFDLWPSKGLLAIIPSIMSIMSIFPSPLPQMILSPAPLF